MKDLYSQGPSNRRIIQPSPKSPETGRVRSRAVDPEIVIDRRRLRDVLNSLESFSGE
jgi:hypothetical protein